ncbi:MAG: DUF1284 domain-containing protein [Lachnospiraceae bacterium]|nr:DUF1284 domain-containing protein [Lachnospiraceae bacterium]
MNDLSVQDFEEPVMLRPHHGMCLAYFKGYGYSDEFAVHMQKVQDYLKTDAIVRLTVETDIICSKCPNNINGDCEKPELVARYDSEVLRRCGLSAGEGLEFTEFFRLVQENILAPKLRGEICGDCQWDEICR